VRFGEARFVTYRRATHPEWKRPLNNSDGTTITTNYTLPLGALISSKVIQVENWLWNQGPTADMPETFISGDKVSFVVLLMTNFNEINIVLSADPPPLGESTKTMSAKEIFLRFNDETIARRVAEAFHHASDLCRKKEAF
jgi:hypothetical protein